MKTWNGFTFNPTTLELTTNAGKILSAGTMAEIANEYSGANRIHKPMALLFWIDCKNGKSSNWK
jgi:hypothetical protein